MHIEIDCLVIGAGVVGLAVARELQSRGREVVLVDKESRFGTETSARNSEVIHAGIYYAPGSLKARLCVEGKALLFDWCERQRIPHRRIGKLIVATDEAEIATLEKYQARALANGVPDLQWLDAAQVRFLEPEVQSVRGLLSPSTGILDSHAYMQSLLGDFERMGGLFIRQAPVLDGAALDGAVEIRLGDAEGTTLTARTVVNSAGLHAPALARRIKGIRREAVPEPRYAIGHYFSLARPSPFKHLVYPVARAGGLGVHVTLDLGGAARFGPDISWREGIDYAFDASREADFARAIRSYWPALGDGDLQPAFTGIRPKISGPDELGQDQDQDFLIQTAEQHGVPGLINLFGIESPGLTASLALARETAERASASALKV